jgi:hypothetical protein
MLPRTPSAATQTSSAREICNNVQQETWSSEMLDGFLLHQNVLELSNISLERPYSKLLATGKIIKQGLSNQRFIIQ